MKSTFTDPVCGMDVTPDNAAGKTEYKGTTYYFCSRGCKSMFEAAPEKYLQQEGAHSHGCC